MISEQGSSVITHLFTQVRIPAFRSIVCCILPLFVSLITLNCGSPDVVWKFKTGDFVYGSPSISGDRLLIGSNDNHLYALDLKTGEERWKSNLGERVFSRPLVEQNAVYVGAANGYFFALHPLNGEILWKWKTDGMISYNACADEEGLFFGGDDSRFWKLDRSGKQLWVFQAGHRLWGHCLVYKNLVITSSWDGNFYGLDRHTGIPVWKVSSGLFNYAGGELYEDTVYFATHEKLFRIQADSGKVLALIQVGYLDHPAVFQNLLWTLEQGLVKRELNGKELGRVKFLSSSTADPVPAKKSLIAATRDNKLVAVNSDLEILWTFRGDDDFTSAGIYHNGMYYAGNRDSYVYALRLPE